MNVYSFFVGFWFEPEEFLVSLFEGLQFRRGEGGDLTPPDGLRTGCSYFYLIRAHMCVDRGRGRKWAVMQETQDACLLIQYLVVV